MKCRRTKKLLEEYIEGNLDRDIEKDVEEHLRSCEKCAAEYNELKKYRDTLSLMNRKVAPPDLLDRIHGRIHEQEEKGITVLARRAVERIFLPARIKLPVEAAGLIAVVFLVFVLYNPFEEVKRTVPREGGPHVEDTVPVMKTKHRADAPLVRKTDDRKRARIPDEEVRLASKVAQPKISEKKASASAEVAVTEKIARSEKQDSKDSLYRVVLGPRIEDEAAVDKYAKEKAYSGNLSRDADSAKRVAPDRSVADSGSENEVSRIKALPVSVNMSISRITGDSGGKVISRKTDPATGITRSITVSIPSANLEQYMKRLRAQWPVKEEQLPEPESDKGTVTIIIILPLQQ